VTLTCVPVSDYSGVVLLFNVYCSAYLWCCPDGRVGCPGCQLPFPTRASSTSYLSLGVTIHHLLLMVVLASPQNASLPVFVGLLYNFEAAVWNARVMLHPGLLPPKLIVTTVRIGCPKLHFAHS
jgi:hypothetical protein